MAACCPIRACNIVTYVLPLGVIELRYYLGTDGESPFEQWFSALETTAAAKVSVALARVEQGNLSNVKG